MDAIVRGLPELTDEMLKISKEWRYEKGKGPLKTWCVLAGKWTTEHGGLFSDDWICAFPVLSPVPCPLHPERKPEVHPWGAGCRVMCVLEVVGYHDCTWGPEAETEQEAIELWNKVMGGW